MNVSSVDVDDVDNVNNNVYSAAAIEIEATC